MRIMLALSILAAFAAINNNKYKNKYIYRNILSREQTTCIQHVYKMYTQIR